MANTVQCRFEEYMFNTGDKYYKASISDRTIFNCDDFKFLGFHLPEKSNKDVNYVEFGLPCAIIPQGLTKVFPNMKVLGIYNSDLKTIVRSDLVEYQNLERFICESCQVEYLPRDLFEGFKNLKYIKFYRNKLTIIEPNILDGLDKLDYVDFRSNINYSKIYSASSIYVSDMDLEQIRNYLIEKFLELDQERIRSYVDSYPDRREILKMLRERSNDIDANLKLHELTYKFYDQDRLKNVEDHQTFKEQMTTKINDLENLNSGLSWRITKFKVLEEKLRKEIEELMNEIGNERKEKKMLRRDLQGQIDELAQKIQSVLLVDTNK